MISYEDAYALVMEQVRTLGHEVGELTDARGRVLAEAVCSDMDMPPFDKSAMDGYACRRADLARELRIVEEIPAGRVPVRSLGPQECAKIMTGAPVPEGADCVIMVEYTETIGPDKIRFTGDKTATNICVQGEDMKTGTCVLEAGEIIGPPHIAVLAAVGCTQPQVSVRPRVGVIATGSELVEPDARAEGACIRNSNSHQLCAQIDAMCAQARYYGIVADTAEAIDTVIAQAKSENDLIILSRGVSMGDYDLVPGVLRENGFEFLFDSVAMKPGKPTIFGRAGQTFCCGLPGNPVSTFVVFEILLKPFLYGLMGHTYDPYLIPAALDETIRRRKTSRRAHIPVVFTPEGTVRPVEYHGSAHINAMTQAQGLVAVPIGTAELAQGSTVHVRQI